jgi:ubiquinone/menaquinone biosynthesis C-methylase UbiE
VDLLIGLDISYELLKTAYDRQKGVKNSKVALVFADADYLPFRERTFDKIFAVTILQNVNPVDQTISEITRTAKNDAVIVLSGLKKVFSKEKFMEIIEGNNLNCVFLNEEEIDKDIVAVCQKKTETM